MTQFIQDEEITIYRYHRVGNHTYKCWGIARQYKEPQEGTPMWWVRFCGDFVPSIEFDTANPIADLDKKINEWKLVEILTTRK